MCFVLMVGCILKHFSKPKRFASLPEWLPKLTDQSGICCFVMDGLKGCSLFPSILFHCAPMLFFFMPHVFYIKISIFIYFCLQPNSIQQNQIVWHCRKTWIYFTFNILCIFFYSFIKAVPCSFLNRTFGTPAHKCSNLSYRVCVISAKASGMID